MMIVIPSNFSQKALSITSKEPEKVTLSYKINDVGNENLKVEAEKIAASVLEDFNRRIIDVFFASILMNLQDAQDNISEIVKREKNIVGIYNNNINSPLSKYTEQFKLVQDNTSVSKESFRGFQDIMKNYNLGLTQLNKDNLAFKTNVESLVKQESENIPPVAAFVHNLKQFDESLSTDAVENELMNLKQANTFIHNEFQVNKGTTSLYTQTNALQNYIKDVNSKIYQMNQEVMEKINGDLFNTVNKYLEDTFRNNPDGTTNEIKLTHLTDEKINDAFKSAISSLMMNLPTYEIEDLKGLGLSEDTYENLFVLTNKFYSENSGLFPGGMPSGTDVPLQNLTRDIKQNMVDQGVALTASAHVVNSALPITFKLRLIEGFQFNGNIRLVNEAGDEIPFSLNQISPNEWELKDIEIKDIDQTITLSGNARLKSIEEEINIFHPVTWKWDIIHTHVFEVIDRTEEEEPEEPEEPGEENGGEDGDPDNGDDSSDNPEIDSQSVDGDQGGESGDDDGNEGTGEGDEEEEPAPEPIKTREETIYSTTPVDVQYPTMFDNVLQTVAEKALQTVKHYEELILAFHLYYGMDATNSAQIQSLKNDPSATLDSQALELSYYTLFNKVDMIAKIASLSTHNFTNDFRKRLTEFQQRIANYQSVMNQAEIHSQDVSLRLLEAKNKAELLNSNLALLLADIDNWRKKSLDLVNENEIVVGNMQEEHEVMLQLSNEYADLFIQTQSVEQESGHNLDSTDMVYQTFEAIDDESKRIQDSGVTLIKEAQNLADHFVEKLKTDENFAKNFAAVMNNSRIGDRQNEQLYEFLSNPVQKVNAGIIVAGDKTIPYYIILICIIVSIFTGYTIANHEKKRARQNQFAEEMSIALKNLPITLLTICIAVMEGAIIGYISAYIFKMEDIKLLIWIGIIVLITVVFVLVIVYLLRQLQMLGMFAVATMLTMYLFLTNAVGLRVDHESFLGKVKDWSPLQYVEQFMLHVTTGTGELITTVSILIGVAILFIIGNLFVSKGKRTETEAVHEEMVIN